MATPTNMTFAGQGPIFIGTYDATNGRAAQGFLTGVKRVGCSNRMLKLTLARETQTIKESCSGQALTLKRYTKGLTASITLEMAQFSRDELALAMYGTTLSRAAATVTAEQLPTVAVGDYVHTKYPGISSVVVKDSAGTPANLVAGTHYRLDSAAHGRIQILGLGSYTQPLKVDYAYGEHAQVTGLTAASTRRGLIFDGVNVAEANAPVRLFIPLIDFDPAKDFDWLSQDEAKLTLEGEILYADALAGDGDWGPYLRIDALPADA